MSIPKTIPVKRLTKKTSTVAPAHGLVMRQGKLFIRTRGDKGTAVLTPLTGEQAVTEAMRQSTKDHAGVVAHAVGISRC